MYIDVPKWDSLPGCLSMQSLLEPDQLQEVHWVVPCNMRSSVVVSVLARVRMRKLYRTTVLRKGHKMAVDKGFAPELLFGCVFTAW